MFPRFISAGIVILSGVPLLGADDLVVPPAPSTDNVPKVQVPEQNATDQVPELKTQPLPPIPSEPESQVEQNLPPAPGLYSSPSQATTPPATDSASPQAVPSKSNGNPVTSPAQPMTTTPSSSLPNGSVVMPQSVYGSQYNPGFPGSSLPQYNSFSTAPSYGPPPVPMSNPALIGGEHLRFPYFSYRRPWYTPGPASRNVNIIW